MNSIITSNESQRKAARVAGFSFLFAIAIVVIANYGISFRLIIPCNLIYLVNLLFLLTALYVIFKPVNHHLALVATFCKLVVALMWGVTALNMLGALRLLGDAAYLPVF